MLIDSTTKITISDSSIRLENDTTGERVELTPVDKGRIAMLTLLLNHLVNGEN